MTSDTSLTPGRVVRAASSAGGAALAAATRGIAAVRPAAKPLHPLGVVRAGRLVRHGSITRSGVAWLDEPGEDDVLVRLSRAIGLPRGVPDIHGLAMRVTTPGNAGDLLLATTGWGRLGRFVLVPTRDAGSRPLTSLLPYRTAGGAVVLGARAAGADTYALSWAPYDGDWRAFATLHLGARHDGAVSFDPVRHQLTGLDQYPVVTRLREPAYLSARRSRRT